MLSEYLKQVHRHFALERKLASSNYQRSASYKNCKRRRKEAAKICKDCPFRSPIESTEQEK